MSLKHGKVVNVADDPAAAGKLRPSDWGSPSTDYDASPTHVFDGGALGALAMRDTDAVDGLSWLPSEAGFLVSDGDDEIPVFRPLLAADIPALAYAPLDLTGFVVNDDIVSLAWGKLTDVPVFGGAALLNVGTAAGTVAAGDHLHAGVYEPVFGMPAGVAVGSVLVSGGIGAAPAWSATPTLTSVTIQGSSIPFIANDALGAELFRIDSDFSTNLFIGKNAGAANTPLSTTQGQQNTFIGSAAGQNNTTGYASLFVGFGAGFGNTTGIANTNIGYQSGYANQTGTQNTNLGVDAGAANTASDNIFIGFHSGSSFAIAITGAQNVFIGNETAITGTSLNNNSALGYRAGRNLTSGINNNLFGSLSGFGLTTGAGNVFIGKEAGTALTTGTDNVFIGFRAGFSAQTSNFNNTGIGYLSLFSVTTGSINTAVGSGSGFSITTGQQNTFIGYDAGNNALQLVSASNSTAIGKQTYTTKSNQVVLGNASVTETLLRGNVGVGVTVFGTSAATVLGIGNGTEPSTSPADMVQLYSVDLSAGNATLGLRTETAVVTESVVSDRTLSVRINGTTYKLCLKA